MPAVIQASQTTPPPRCLRVTLYSSYINPLGFVYELYRVLRVNTPYEGWFNWNVIHTT